MLPLHPQAANDTRVSELFQSNDQSFSVVAVTARHYFHALIVLTQDASK